MEQLVVVEALEHVEMLRSARVTQRDERVPLQVAAVVARDVEAFVTESKL